MKNFQDFENGAAKPKISEEHYAAARGLIREAQQEAEQKRYDDLEETWLDALRYFRKKERELGPPDNSECAKVYSFLVNNLRSLGKFILLNPSNPESPKLKSIEIALKDLALADYAIEHLNSEEEQYLEDRLGG